MGGARAEPRAGRWWAWGGGSGGAVSVAPVGRAPWPHGLTGWVSHCSSIQRQAGHRVFGLLTLLGKLPASVIKHSAECSKSS